MKQFYPFALALILFSLSAQSQVVQQGQKIIGGAFQLGLHINNHDSIVSGSSSVKNRQFHIGISPGIGTAIKNNLVLGYRAHLGYFSSKNLIKTAPSYGESHGYSLGAGIFLEKFFPVSNRFSLSVQPGVQAGYNYTQNDHFSNQVKVGENNSKTLQVGISAVPSLNYSISNKLLLQVFLDDFISLGYSRTNYENSSMGATFSRYKSATFGLNTSLTSAQTLSPLSFGFRYIFN